MRRAHRFVVVLATACATVLPTTGAPPAVVEDACECARSIEQWVRVPVEIEDGGELEGPLDQVAAAVRSRSDFVMLRVAPIYRCRHRFPDGSALVQAIGEGLVARGVPRDVIDVTFSPCRQCHCATPPEKRAKCQLVPACPSDEDPSLPLRVEMSLLVRRCAHARPPWRLCAKKGRAASWDPSTPARAGNVLAHGAPRPSRRPARARALAQRRQRGA